MSSSNGGQNQWNDTTILPDNSSESKLGFGPSNKDVFLVGNDPSQTLTGEQLDWLLKRLSTDDQKELGQTLRECTFQMTMTRGLPFAALVTGSMYMARSRLPESLRIGPKRWPFYALIAIGSITSANVLSMNQCGQRVKPKLFDLYQKYSEHQPGQTTTYEALRAANRQHFGDSQSSQGQPQGQQQSPIQELDRLPTRPSRMFEDVPTMSGTPSSTPNSGYGQPDRNTERGEKKGSSYGDQGFS